MTWSVLSPANIFKELCTPAASPPWLTSTRYFIFPASFFLLALSQVRIYWWFYCTSFGIGFILSNVTLPRWHLSGNIWHLSYLSSQLYLSCSFQSKQKESRLFSAFYFSLNARQGTVNLLILHSILNQIVHPVHRMTVHFQTDVNDGAIHHVV